jgi:hypothetical protein
MQRLLLHDRRLRIAVTSPASSGEIADLCRLAAIFILDQFRDQATFIEQTPLDWPKLQNYTESKWTSANPTIFTSNTIQHTQFVNVESWVSSARNYDLCISFRIHGSMTFIAAGVPTIVIPTDFRVLELISAMKVPYLAPVDLKAVLDQAYKHDNQLTEKSGFDFLHSLMKQAKNTNFLEFELNRRKMVAGWKTILNGVGLEMDPGLLNILKSPLVM